MMDPADTDAHDSPSPTQRPASDLSDFFADEVAHAGGEILDDAVDIGRRLREARVSAALSQREIADRLGVREETIEKWEVGITSPRGHRVSKLAGMLGVSISWILMGRGVEPAAHIDDVAQIRSELELVRARLEDAVNELAVLDQRLGSLPTQ